MLQLITIFTQTIEQAISYLSYNPEKPLLFTQSFFWLYFLVVLLGYSALYKNIKFRNNYLFAISIYFYYRCSGPFLILLLFAIVANYYIGAKIYKSRNNKVRKLLVILSIVLSLVMLSYFKYTYFFVQLFNDILGTHFVAIDYLAAWSNNIAGSHFDISTIILPAGISFFSFQALSYTIDLYRRDTPPVKNVFDFGFYLAFFPQLVAGPIIRASDFIPQIYKPYHITQREFSLALFLIIGGLIKKMVVSDYISLNFVDRVFDNPLSYSGFENLLAVYGYSLQIYCDFSGYTDIAIGLSLLLGFRITENFLSPYKAVNLTDFWRRWHISLSSWLRDYLYIPLGGNRKGKIQTYINLLITMLLGGLWHGASWRFVIWGGIHGLGLALDKIRPKTWHFEQSKLGRIVSIFITFQVVSLAWIFFRAADMTTVKQIFAQITTNPEWQLIPSIIAGYWKTTGLIAAGMLIHWLPAYIKANIKEWFIQTPVFAKVLLTILAILFIYQFKSSALQPFIYFQF